MPKLKEDTVRLTFRTSQENVEFFDEVAESLHITRNAAINLIINQCKVEQSDRTWKLLKNNRH